MKQLWQSLMMVREADRRAFGRRVVYVLLQSLLPLVNLLFLRNMIDAVEQSLRGLAEPMAFLPWMLAMAAVFLAGRVVAALDRVNSDVLSQRLIDYMADLVQRQAARLDMAYYDTPEYHDTFHRAQQEAGTRPLQVLAASMAVAGAAVGVAGVVAMLVSASWWVVPVMLVAVVPSFIVRLHKARSIYAFRRSNTQLYRQTAYFGRLLTSRESAAEMRTLGASAYFRRLFVEARARLVVRLLAISRRMGVADVLCAVVEVVAMVAVVWLLAAKAVGGALTIGAFVMLFEAFRRGQGYLTNLVAGLASLYDSRLFIANLIEYLQLEPAVTDPDEPLEVPEKIEEIALCDVTFRYPGMRRDVLSHCTLRARVGEVCRLQGENGQGKSTIVRLLLRLYDPQDGTVTLNGIDIRRFRQADLRARMGVLFQEFVRYQCTLADNVALGNPARPEPPRDEAMRLSGADAVADALPQGENTQLGRMFDGGSELSMGQWQRVALARALQSDAPVLLLDEPLAWQDSASRQHFADALEQLKQHKIVILITHV